MARDAVSTSPSPDVSFNQCHLSSRLQALLCFEPLVSSTATLFCGCLDDGGRLLQRLASKRESRLLLPPFPFVFSGGEISRVPRTALLPWRRFRPCEFFGFALAAADRERLRAVLMIPSSVSVLFCLCACLVDAASGLCDRRSWLWEESLRVV